MFKAYIKTTVNKAIQVEPILCQNFIPWLENQSSFIQNWVKSFNFKAEDKSPLMLADADGHLEKVILPLEKYENCWAYSQLSSQLPTGIYTICNPELTREQLNQAALGWGLGVYQFTRYKSGTEAIPQLLIDERYAASEFEPMVSSLYLIRDLINTPAQDLMPEDLAKTTLNLAHSFGANVTITTGKDLLTKNYPAIYTVGKASVHIPHLIDLTWGNEHDPKLTLIGKGVCFDSGGLDLKSSEGMLLMKKDMAGAAHVLGLAQLIMTARLPLRLRVLIPAVENAIGSNAYHPGDIIKMRSGKTVEVGNTDAEGRLILADALADANEENPSLIIDMASLTGAARIALGPEVPIFFTPCDTLATELQQCSRQVNEEIWRLPLYQPYCSYLKSRIADINNSASTSYAGAITAALFLQSFVDENTQWIHFDLMGWNISDLPGKKAGGEAMGIRVLYKFICDKFKIK